MGSLTQGELEMLIGCWGRHLAAAWDTGMRGKQLALKADEIADRIKELAQQLHAVAPSSDKVNDKEEGLLGALYAERVIRGHKDRPEELEKYSSSESLGGAQWER